MNWVSYDYIDRYIGSCGDLYFIDLLAFTNHNSKFGENVKNRNKDKEDKVMRSEKTRKAVWELEKALKL